MGYANPIEAMGVEKFIAAAKAADIDGVIVVDYPPEECEQFAGAGEERSGIDPIFLLAPTSTDKRIEQVARVGSGYLYYVSLRGITGAAHIDSRATSRPASRRSARRRGCPSAWVSASATRESARAWRESRGRGGDRQPYHPGDRSRGRRPGGGAGQGVPEADSGGVGPR